MNMNKMIEKSQILIRIKAKQLSVSSLFPSEIQDVGFKKLKENKIKNKFEIICFSFSAGLSEFFSFWCAGLVAPYFFWTCVPFVLVPTAVAMTVATCVSTSTI